MKVFDVTADELRDYEDKLHAASTASADTFTKLARAKNLPTLEHDERKSAIYHAANDTVNTFSNATGSIACDFFDAHVEGAAPSEIPPQPKFIKRRLYERIEEHEQTHELGDDEFLQLVSQDVYTEVYHHANRTTKHNAIKNKLRYARVPMGNACAFCLMLATRGFVYHTRTSAGEDKGHYHVHCHCKIVAGNKDTRVEGYNPREILKALDNKVTIAGLAPGEPMSFEEADHLRANPKYKYMHEAWVKYTKGEITEETFKQIQNNYAGYSVNCQTCVVANEARRRGYNVRALPNNQKSNSAAYLLSRDTSLAYIDRETGKQPKYITYTGKGVQDYRGRAIPTKSRFVAWLNSDGVVEENARYTIEMCWKSGGGHIICVDRTKGELRLFDPQINRRYTGEDISNYFDSVKFFTTYKGNKISIAPKLLRVDNVDFNKKLVDKILEKA